MTSLAPFAVIIAIVVLVLFASGAASTPVPGSHIRSFALTYLTLILLVGGCLTLAWNSGLDEVGLLTLGFGLWFLLFTLMRVWWFWNHPLSSWWRATLGDRGARVLFVAIGAFFVAAGSIDIRQGLADVALCRRLYSEATNAHDRVRALYTVPRNEWPGLLNPIGVHAAALSCQRYRERGAF